MELERDVEEYLSREVEAARGVCLKHGVNGWPDRIVMLPGGKLVWCEVKRKGGRASCLQLIRLQRLRGLGQRAELICSKADVDALIQGE